MKPKRHPFELFRSDPESIADWRKVLMNPVTQTVLGLLRENGPEFVRSAYGLTDIDVARRYGDIGGYARFYQTLLDMAEPWPLSDAPVRETYEPEKPPDA